MKRLGESERKENIAKEIEEGIVRVDWNCSILPWTAGKHENLMSSLQKLWSWSCIGSAKFELFKA